MLDRSLKLEGIELIDQYYKGKPADLDFSGALSYTGSMQIELIKQHCDTPSIYNEYVNNEKGGASPPMLPNSQILKMTFVF